MRKTPEQIQQHCDFVLQAYEDYLAVARYDREAADTSIIDNETWICQTRRWHFISHWCKTLDEHHPTNPIQRVPNKAYLEFISDFDNSEQGYLAAYYKSRQVLVSWLFTCFAVHEACLLSGQKVFIQRMNEQSAKALIDRAMIIIKNLPPFLKPYNLKPMTFKISSEEMNSEFTALPKGAAQIVGRTGTRMVIDECQENDELDPTFRKVRPALDSATGTPGKLSFIGTPEIGYWLQLIEDTNNPEEGGIRGKTKHKKPMRGIETWQNAHNKINVCQVHIFADPDKDPERDGEKWFAHIVANTPKKNFEKEYNLNARSEAGDLIYPDFKCHYGEDGHLRKPFEIDFCNPRECTLYFIFDYGLAVPSAGLWIAALKDGRIVAYREHYVAEQHINWHSDRIRELEKWLPRTEEETQEPWEWIKHKKKTKYTEPIHIRIIDPATGKRKEVGEPTIMGKYNSARNQMGFILGKTPWDIGRDLVSFLLMARLPDGRPKFVVFDTLANFIREISNYRTEKRTGKIASTTDPPPGGKPMSKDDHLMDDLRMGVLTPPNLKFIPPEEYNNPVRDECDFPTSTGRSTSGLWTPSSYHGYAVRKRRR